MRRSSIKPTGVSPLREALLGACCIAFVGLVAATGTARARDDLSASCRGAAAANACVAVTPFRDRPRTVVRLEEAPGEKPLEVRVVLLQDGHTAELPRFFGSARWPFCSIPVDGRGRVPGSAVAAGDFTGDEREDLAVVAECMTGVGPTGAEPFYAGAVYAASRDGALLADDAAGERLTELLQSRCARALDGCDTAALARLAARGAHVTPREGPARP